VNVCAELASAPPRSPSKCSLSQARERDSSQIYARKTFVYLPNREFLTVHNSQAYCDGVRYIPFVRRITAEYFITLVVTEIPSRESSLEFMH
jgi:hypothetical protein